VCNCHLRVRPDARDWPEPVQYGNAENPFAWGSTEECIDPSLRARPDPQKKRVGEDGGRCVQDDNSEVINNPGVGAVEIARDASPELVACEQICG
jgi:hypothetical protein